MYPAEIAPDAVVQFKSGGPTMAVRWVGDEYGESTAVRDWFIQDWFIQDKAPGKKNQKLSSDVSESTCVTEST
jgi:hypothetical protein